MTKRDIPWLMSAGRALLGPLLIAGARSGWNGAVLAGIVLSALMSDIFDGVLARRWKCDTAAVRLGDSMADMVFYIGAAIALWLAEPQVWRRNGVLLLGLIAVEASRFVLEFWKFGKPASYHSWMAKVWGLVLATAVVAAFAGGRWPWLMPVALGWGVLSNLEGVAMSLVLPVWRKDVKSLAAALRLRRESFACVNRRTSAAAACLLLGALLLPAPQAFALNTDDATYTNGTTPLARGTSGQLEVKSADQLIFRANGGAGTIAIPYSNIRNFEYHSELNHRLGVLPLIFVSLVAAQPRSHTYNITYTDPDGVVQVVVFEVPKVDFEGLCAILQARSPAKCRGTCPAGAR